VPALLNDLKHAHAFSVSCGPVARNEPKDDRDHRQQEQDVNEPARHVERSETNQPQDEKHDCDGP